MMGKQIEIQKDMFSKSIQVTTWMTKNLQLKHFHPLNLKRLRLSNPKKNSLFLMKGHKVIIRSLCRKSQILRHRRITSRATILMAQIIKQTSKKELVRNKWLKLFRNILLTLANFPPRKREKQIKLIKHTIIKMDLNYFEGSSRSMIILIHLREKVVL